MIVSSLVGSIAAISAKLISSACIFSKDLMFLLGMVTKLVLEGKLRHNQGHVQKFFGSDSAGTKELAKEATKHLVFTRA